MMVFVMSISLAACGGESSSTFSQNTEPQYTAEQQALAQEFSDMVDAYNEIVDKVNASPELLSHEELVDVMNKISEEITAADQYFADPEILTPEVMNGLKTVIDAAYDFIADVEELLKQIEG